MAQNGSIMDSLVLIVPMVLIFYFLIIRPQKKQAKQKKLMIDSLKKGDKIITTSGMIGEIEGFKDLDRGEIKIAQNTKILIVKQAIATFADPKDVEKLNPKK